jgi:hypothetical protein
MNEKIKQLAIAAKLEHCVSHARLQEFAELIVKECAHAIAQHNAKSYQVSQPFSIEQVLTKHFGVE